MSVGACIRRRSPAPGAEAGFTMIIALGVMLVSSLLLVATFTAIRGDAHQSHVDVTQKQAYFAALAGIQEYQYKLEANANYWSTCPKPEGAVPGEANESYEVSTMAAESDPVAGHTC